MRVMRVDSDALEELSDKGFNYFCDSLFVKFTAMQSLGLLSFVDFEEMKVMWVNTILKNAEEEPYKTVYYVMYDENDKYNKIALAIVQHEFGVLGNLKNMRLREFYTLNLDYSETYRKMKNYLLRNYDYYTTTTIFHKEAYQRKEHMTMGMMECIY